MLKRLFYSNTGAAVTNFVTAMLAFMVTRIAFFLVNYDTFAPRMSWQLAGSMLHGSLVFDVSALLYLNALYLVLMLLPLHLKEGRGFHTGLKWLWLVTNGLGLAANLTDCVYFSYTGRRSTITVFSEFVNENNIAGVFLTEFVNHWYLVVTFVALIALMAWCYVRPRIEVYRFGWHYYLAQLLSLLITAPLAIVGIRGSATAGTRPITVSNANQYVNRPVEATVVLNTPFSIIRSIGKRVFVTPHYMTPEAMQRAYTPVHAAPSVDSLTLGPRNVVILIVESMGKEYIGAFNRELDGGHYRGYMPFIDSLVNRSLTFKYSYANGRISMDAMPSILCGLPMMVEPFFLTPASLNDVQGLPAMLAGKGYDTAFFHGGHNISMGFSAFAHSIGYARYDGLDEYCRSPKYGGMKDFDGKWAIWDEPFLQFSLDGMEQLREPFLATVFTATSHPPYNVPTQYAGTFTDGPGDLPIHKCVRYTDHALRRFFERAAQEPWFDRTIFVLVADHTNLAKHAVYKTDLGLYSIPILFFTPDGALPAAMREDVIAQQADITPTLLHMVGYDKPYLAFGNDLLSTPAQHTWAFSYNNGIYQFLQGERMIQFDGNHTTAVYNYRADPLLQHNTLGTVPDSTTRAMQHTLQAIIQQYMTRMNNNTLIPGNEGAMK